MNTEIPLSFLVQGTVPCTKNERGKEGKKGDGVKICGSVV